MLGKYRTGPFIICFISVIFIFYGAFLANHSRETAKPLPDPPKDVIARKKLYANLTLDQRCDLHITEIWPFKRFKKVFITRDGKNEFYDARDCVEGLELAINERYYMTFVINILLGCTAMLHVFAICGLGGCLHKHPHGYTHRDPQRNWLNTLLRGGETCKPGGLGRGDSSKLTHPPTAREPTVKTDKEGSKTDKEGSKPKKKVSQTDTSTTEYDVTDYYQTDYDYDATDYYYPTDYDATDYYYPTDYEYDATDYDATAKQKSKKKSFKSPGSVGSVGSSKSSSEGSS